MKTETGKLRTKRVRVKAGIVVGAYGLTIFVALSTRGSAAAEFDNRREKAAARQVVQDVALDAQDALRGTLVDRHGNPVGGRQVLILKRDCPVARCVSDHAGRYRLRRLSGGVYQIIVGRTSCVCRLWAAGSAPPSAKSQLLLVVERDVVRGQSPGYRFSSESALLGAIIITGGAIPLVVDSNRVNRLSGS